MVKRCLLVLILAAIIAGGVFAQKNTITIDVGPTIIGVGIGAASNVVTKMTDMDGATSSGFGIGAQYEFQPFQKLSFAARFAYMGFGFGLTQEEGSINAKADFGISSFSGEGHVRYYPFSGGVFFVDGMVGYGRLMMDVSGYVIVEEGSSKHAENVSLNLARNYIKLGGKLGWRMCFGKTGGGFTFEPSLGYSYGIGLGETLGKQLDKNTTRDIDNIGDFDNAFSLLENYLFIGGPRLSLAFGWRF